MQPQIRPSTDALRNFRLATLVCLSLAASLAARAAPQCVVDWKDVHQQIDGFGASSAFLTATWTTAQADMFFSTNTGMGLSLLRAQIQPGGFTRANEIALMRLAQARGARVWSTPWTPQASFKDNNSTERRQLCFG